MIKRGGELSDHQRSGLSENLAALLSYVFGWITGLIFLLLDKRPYVRFHAAQSIVVFLGLHILRAVLAAIFGMHAVVVWWIRQLGRLHPRCSSSELPKPAESGFVGCTDGESISRRAFQVAVGGRHRREPNRSTYLTSPRFVVACGFHRESWIPPRPLTSAGCELHPNYHDS